MSVTFKPAVTGFTRVFLIDGRARPDHRPSYQSNMKAGAISQSFGDVEDIEVPSPDEFGKFIKVGELRDQVGRVEVTLTGRYAAELKSEMLRLSRQGCTIDAQIIIGACTDPSDYNVFTKKVIIENSFLTDWETEDFGALGSDEQAKIDESVTLSGRSVYETVPTSYASRAGDVVTNELIAGVVCDVASCGECENESTGCQKYFAVSAAAGGSPTTPPDIVFTLDGGTTWYAHDIDSMSSTEDPDDVACLGQYLFVVSQETGSAHYALLSDFKADVDPTFTEVTTGFVPGGGPRAIGTTKNKAFIGGAGGYIYVTENIGDGVEVQDAGTLTTSSYNCVAALNDDFVIAGANDGVISYTANGTLWTSVTYSPVGIGVHITAAAIKSERIWLIGTSAGRLYYTLDGGASWTEKSFPGSGSGTVEDLAVATESVIYMAHTTAANRGRILKSDNFGYDWVVQPSTSDTMALNDRINSVSACSENPDVVFGCGLADNGTDGFLVAGSD